MTVLGVWSCQWRELKPISFGFSGSNTASVSQSATDIEADDGVGFPRVHAGTGAYELVDRSSQA